MNLTFRLKFELKMIFPQSFLLKMSWPNAETKQEVDLGENILKSFSPLLPNTPSMLYFALLFSQ